MTIHVRGAREHNLRNVDATLGDGLTVVTGISGSGKTSLVFDTLYHEARRRFLEVFSLGATEPRLAPAAVDTIDGLGPAIAVGQDLLNRNPNSTLATASGLHPFFRLLFAHFGTRTCAHCGTALTVTSEDALVERLVHTVSLSQTEIFAPLLRRSQGSHRSLLAWLTARFSADAVYVDGQAWSGTPLEPTQPHTVELLIATTHGSLSTNQAREYLETMHALGVHALTIQQDGQRATMATAPLCVQCGAWFGELEPRHFHAPCPHCNGDGCRRCQETGLHPRAVATRWAGKRLPELLAATVDGATALFSSDQQDLANISPRLNEEIVRRLTALQRVGLGYLTLDRPAPTLSRGEAQRVRIATALTSRLEEMLHILDEPTVGLHPADVQRVLHALRDLPGPVIYVEHDRTAAAAADRAVDLGPYAGSNGGRVIFQGTTRELWQQDSPTGRAFSLRERIALPAARPTPSDYLVVRGAHLRNLAGIDVPIPLQRLTVISGVSGSGKSTLVRDVLAASLKAGRPIDCDGVDGPPMKPVLVEQDPIGRNPRSNPATYTKLADIIRDCFAAATGLPASMFSFNRPEGACPACKGMGAVEVRMRYLPSTWIDCASCSGLRFADDVLDARINLSGVMLSIADLYAMPVSEIAPLLLESEYLSASQRSATERILTALLDIGLGYLALGQSSPTLSGGEAQRIKLAKYLGRRTLTKQLLLLDEPSTGLHPHDLAGLLVVLDRLVRAGATIVVVEHNTDMIEAADWVIDLGPGAGPAGGELLFAGPPADLHHVEDSLTGRALRQEFDPPKDDRAQPVAERRDRAHTISIRGAAANNLKQVDVTIPKNRLTVVTGVSGSGKSSLVHNVLEAEARRRFLETLSMYERQSVRAGPEAPVDAVSGLGVTISVGGDRRVYARRATVGSATEISHHLAALFATLGVRDCPTCGMQMRRVTERSHEEWRCPRCQTKRPVAQPRHFTPTTYAAACPTCSGVGVVQTPQPEKLIVHPDKPLCDGAMYSPGFFPKGYLCKPLNHGYDIIQALAARRGFDPATTPWNQMSEQAQQAFLFGDPEPLEVTLVGRKGHTRVETVDFRGFYGWVRDWDVGGTYTRADPCPDCNGARLRPEYLSVTLAGHNIHDLSEMPLAALERTLQALDVTDHPSGSSGAHSVVELVTGNLSKIRARLQFLNQVGLGYLHLNRVTATLSAGEAQRIKLAGLLGSGLTSLTVLLDEPTRGLHPSEVDALLATLEALRDEGNTVIVVEHEMSLIRAADHLIDIGPGSGVEGGRVMASGSPAAVATQETPTGRWLRNQDTASLPHERRQPTAWMTVRGARANNLIGDDVRIPLGMLVGLCGVSGSGKSTLLIDTLGRALAPKKQTTSVAREPIEPGEHDAIDGAPRRVLIVDQSKAGVNSPADFLGISKPLQQLYADSEDAQALGLVAKQLTRACADCKGRGMIKIDMGFLPAIYERCDTCRATGFRPEAWDVQVRGVRLPDLFELTIDQVYETFGDLEKLARPLDAARKVGLGYLTLRQPNHSLSGGEAQRLKIAHELRRKTTPGALYLLDEPTVGQHMQDVTRLIGVLQTLVDDGHSVVLIEHHPFLLAACGWLIEFGPGGGPQGGRIVAEGSPEQVAAGDTLTASYLAQELSRST